MPAPASTVAASGRFAASFIPASSGPGRANLSSYLLALLPLLLLSGGIAQDHRPAHLQSVVTESPNGEATASLPRVLRHQIVFRESGRFGGWPANNGAWVWGDEFLVGFTAGWHLKQDVNRHQMDRSRPQESWLARSRDGGVSWLIEKPASMLPAEDAVERLQPLTGALDFSNLGFALTLRFHKTGPAFFYHSSDRGRSWTGPCNFPSLGAQRLLPRTDYIVHGPREMTVFLAAEKTNGKEGRPLCARTNDGGLSWTRLGYIGPEPAGFAIMPSSLQIDAQTFLSTVRVRGGDSESWIDAWISRDRGANWLQLDGPVADTGSNGGNPPDLLRLRDGRLCLVYGYRSAPRGVRARLSGDQGRTWGDEIVLRADAPTHDLGYSRSFQRADGNIVSVYYYNDGPHTERFIAATTWTPGRP